MKIDNLVAFKGKVTLEKAVWDNVNGMTALFALEQRPHELTAANPFKKFTKMRAGKVGTRFSAVMISGETTVYDDELMLKGWNDGTSGWKVTFWMQGTDGLVTAHPFMEYEKGDEFSLAIVELGDDEAPVDQVKRDRVETAVKHRKQGLSEFAALLCRTSEFWGWLAAAHDVDFSVDGDATYPPPDASIRAREWLCKELNIESRAELDSNTVVAGQFHATIRRPYADWVEDRA